ncbi:MAG TPA: hypothetical protein VNI55_11615 [Gaiellaceae bacterium]|nr:hypothetical protein [Gaiellaceae bacterium]
MAEKAKPQRSKGGRNWIQEERRKTLGDHTCISSWGNPWFPHELPPSSQSRPDPRRASRRAKPGSGGRRLLAEPA